jgi:hypothetical protein
MKKTGSTIRIVERLDKNIFMKGFLKDIYLRPSCHACPSKKLKSGSDITLGDFWGIQEVYPDFDDDKGVSAVMINTSKGAGLYEQLQADAIETSYKTVLSGNPSIERSVSTPKNRSVFMACIDGDSMMERIKDLTRPSFTEYVWKVIRSILVRLRIHLMIKKLWVRR